MKTGAITDEQITAGSFYNASTSPEYARLDGHGAWCPNTTHRKLRINLVVPHIICAIATQGNSQLRLFTKKYRLILRIGEAINHYEDSNGRKVTFFFFFFCLISPSIPGQVVTLINFQLKLPSFDSA